MEINIITKYQVLVDGKEIILEFSGSKKQLESYIKDALKNPKGFRLMNMLNIIRKDGHYFVYLQIRE